MDSGIMPMDAKLVVAKGKTAVKEIPLGPTITIIGRRNDCALRIPSPLVSRQHCELTRRGDRLIVKDLGSSNGTFVNGSKVKQKELKTGDTLGVGPITFIIQLGGAAALSPADTARPSVVSPADDAGDFVVAEEVATDDADFVLGDEAADDGADFVVAESADDDGEFVVAEASDDTEVGDVADFAVSNEPATEADGDFVVAEEAADDSDTVHQGNVAEFVAEDEAPAAAAPEPEVPASDTDAATEAAQPQKKGGLFGRLFKRKPKPSAEAPAEPAKPAAAEVKPEAAESKPTAVESKPAAKSKPAAQAVPPPAPDDASSPEPEMAEFFTSDDDAATAPEKPVGEDELADFLMGLNEKEQ